MMRQIAELGGQPRFGDAVDQPLVLQPMRDELGHRHERELVLLGEASSSGRRAMVPSSLRISQMTPAGMQSGEPREIHAGLGLPDPLQARRRARARSGKMWPGRRRSDGHRRGIDRDVNRRRAIARARCRS